MVASRHSIDDWLLYFHSFDRKRGVRLMRLSDVFMDKPIRKSKRIFGRILTIGALITGLLSSVIIFTTIYGQYTGTFTLSLQRDALEKGIELSDTFDFKNPKTSLSILPVTEIGDMVEGNLNIEAARNQDGQYMDPTIPYYVAYTFYLRNSGQEVINLYYRLRVVDSYKGVETAVMVKYIEEDLNTLTYSDKNYTKNLDNSYIIDEYITNFLEGHVKKITIFLWFDGELTTPAMIGGGIKLELVYTISSGNEDAS
jgi:hypothetical protein